MKFLFSPTTLAFYPECDRKLYESRGTLPNDVVVVEEEVRNVYNFTPPAGRVLGVLNGYPAWVNPPELSKDEIISRNKFLAARLLTTANSEIAWLSAAQEFGNTAEEEAKLLEWRKYVVAIKRMDYLKPVWPKVPDELNG